MTQRVFNIVILGVGGQGIGLLSETIIRGCDYAGLQVKGVDTHGLAQRGGVVQSHVRIGDAYSPLVSPREAHMVIALERHEALRGMNMFLKDGGTLVYYNTVLQPLTVRNKTAECVSESMISEECQQRSITEYPVTAELPDPRMQNMALIREIGEKLLIREVRKEHYKRALADILSGVVLERNYSVLGE